MRKRNPVSGFGRWVWSVGQKKPGFCGWFPKITVGCEKETRFLGEVLGFSRWGERNRVSVVVSQDNCNIPKRNPVSGWGENKA